MRPDLDQIAGLKRRIEALPAATIEEAAALLGVSVRTLYRHRRDFEHFRKRRHLFFTLRGLRLYIEIEEYNPTAEFDASKSEDDPSLADRVKKPPRFGRTRKRRE